MPDKTHTETQATAERVHELTEAIAQQIEQGSGAHAEELLQEAQPLAGNDPELQGLVRMAQARIARWRTIYTEALAHAHQAQQLFSQAGNSRSQVSALMLIGTMYFELSDYGQSIEALSQAHELALALDDRTLQANAVFRMGFCYQRMSLFAEALEVLDRSEAIFREDDNLLALAQALNCRQIVYREMSLHDAQHREMLQQQAQETLDQARAYAEQIGHQQMVAVLRGNQGRLYAAGGQYERALEIYEEQMHQDLQLSPPNQALQWISLGTAQRNVGRSAEALHSLRRALSIADAAQCKRELGLAHHELSQTYEQLGQQEQALQHYKLYHDTERLIFNEQNERVARVTALRLEAERERIAAEMQAQLTQREHEALREKNDLLEQLLQQRTSALEQQSEMLQLIDDLSTPVLPLLSGVLVVPLVGRLDERRCAKLSEEVLRQVAQQQAQAVLLDITGVLIVDPSLAAALVDLSRAVRLLGCRMLVVGIRPEIAEAIIGMGLSLSDMTSHASLAEGLRVALLHIGLSLAPRRPAAVQPTSS